MRANGWVAALGLAGLATSACVVDLQGLHVSGGIATNEKAERVETVPLALAPGATLTFDAGFGDVTVATSDDGRAELTATIRARGRTRAEAEGVLARYALTLEDGPDGPVVRLVGEPLRVAEGRASAELGAHADFEAVVPAGMQLVAHSDSGDLQVRGALGGCRLETSYGDIAVEGEARTSYGDVGCDFPITIEAGQLDKRGTLRGTVGSGAGSVTLSSGSGDVALRKL